MTIPDIKVEFFGGNVIVKEQFTILGVTIPEGFKSDGASINIIQYALIGLVAVQPLVLIALVISTVTLRTSYHPRHLIASIVHDYLCEKEDYEKADKLFEEILRETDTDWGRRLKVFGVRTYHKIRYGV